MYLFFFQENYNLAIEFIKGLFGKSKFTFQLLWLSLMFKLSKCTPGYKEGYRQKLQKLKEVLLVRPTICSIYDNSTLQK